MLPASSQRGGARLPLQSELLRRKRPPNTPYVIKRAPNYAAQLGDLAGPLRRQGA